MRYTFRCPNVDKKVFATITWLAFLLYSNVAHANPCDANNRHNI
ncbi:exotoxin H precursor [Streptococcus pyogenes]|nr:exotoxin H precursor [Streptococcus pyogenes]VEE00066.1 exotoxin H precursor [Streptococcus pyogenes]VEF01429.1 exotoxin H precursor [Streptococcus pyogenes]VGT30307.1 exotoxin H precursor [Streptococcus pyogenes]VHI69415.1 exotoxin H precursor [Streptococcus pyogenes]